MPGPVGKTPSPAGTAEKKRHFQSSLRGLGLQSRQTPAFKRRAIFKMSLWDWPLASRHRLLPATLGLLLAVLLPAAARAQSARTNAVAEKPAASAANPPPRYAGSASCRECHSKFYTLWSTSFHGLAMQPYTAELAKTKLTPQKSDVVAGRFRFRADLQKGVVIERTATNETRYPITQTMGGKNVYYFLTPLERGWLQVLPVAYDVRRQEWFDTTASAMRHFGGPRDEVLYWKERQLTFNTSCFGCHVSQLSKNYDLKSDSYHTTWAEPGINCETCHGPSSEHAPLFRNLAPNQPAPKDLKLIAISELSIEQRNATCAPCHAKMSPVTMNFVPGERYFDHFDLVAYENADFYPDGRDLGENYTYTSWRRARAPSPASSTASIATLRAGDTGSKTRPKPTTPACRATRRG